LARRWTRSPAARADAIDIWSWIADDSPRAADAILASFDEALQLLLDFPQAGSTRDDLAVGIRMLPVEGYLLFYRITADGVDVVRVPHRRRDVRPDLF
jgi:toxin ParE1/3/4